MQPQTSNAKKPSGFIMVTRDMLMSEAYKSLTPSAAKALPLFIMKVHEPLKDPMRYYGTEFKFPYSEAKQRYGFAERTFRNAIRQLEKYGFIEQVWKGGIKKGLKSESVFRLSDRWKSYGADSKSTPERTVANSMENTSRVHQPLGKAVDF